MHPPRLPEVVIAGTGISACALAILLRERGFQVTLLRRSGPGAPSGVIESIPWQTAQLFAEVGLQQVLGDAGAVVVNGFVNAWKVGQPVRVAGWRIHLDRAALGQSALTQALHAGAVVVSISSPLMLPRQTDSGSVGVSIDGRWRDVFAAVDATGRSAAWSRPVAHDRPAIATLYQGPGREVPQPGQIARLACGWAYQLSHPRSTTVGLVLDHEAGPCMLDSQVARAVAVHDPDSFLKIGHRTASVQWSKNPVERRLLAVGDAALSYSPIAGMGIRFALASALAAANVLTTWRDGNAEVASAYYRTFLSSARQRHLGVLSELFADFSTANDKSSIPLQANRPVQFSARRCVTGISRAQTVVPDVAFLLPDGGLVRWVGTFDLMILFHLACVPRLLCEVRSGLMAHGLTGENADALLGWGLEREILSWRD